MRLGDVKFFVKTDFVVVETYLFALLDCLVHDVDIVEKRLVVRLVPLFDRVDVPDVTLEVLSAEGYEFVDELPRVRGVDVARGQHAVDEKAKFRIFEFSRGKIRAVCARFYVKTHFFEIRYIPSDRFSFAYHVVVALENIYDILLCERMLLVAVLVKNLIYPHDQRLFCFKCHTVLRLALRFLPNFLR